MEVSYLDSSLSIHDWFAACQTTLGVGLLFHVLPPAPRRGKEGWMGTRLLTRFGGFVRLVGGKRHSRGMECAGGVWPTRPRRRGRVLLTGRAWSGRRPSYL
jgi:hypothetical protein